MYQNLLDEIGRELAEHPDFCTNHERWESEVATPALESNGWIVQGWFTGDGDSFGPLTRYGTAEKDGDVMRFIYG